MLPDWWPKKVLTGPDNLTGGINEPPLKKRSAEADVNLRSEAEAPFRSLRLVFYGFNTVSATVAFVITMTQLAGALGHAPNALPLNDVVQGIGIDVAAIVIFSLLLRGDLKARDKQIARMTREERLGQLQLELANKKVMRLTQLRSFSRVVIAAGTPAQVAEAVASAEPYKEELIKRGVLVVPLPCFDDPNAQASISQSPLEKEDLRWKATPLRQNEWRDWFVEQMALANAKPDRGLYMGLRLDGRVRASGVGPPPWARFVAELAPVEGMWKGLGDGFDGAV
ncbi:hypothetical protein WJX72_002596 [[Myrmecia] bisecta]|uniref:SMODS and SLOG-associating 2TM effector domain-containing protein n=1 Tax=[Myrmecia] bisecta TaxID=41462 RepID=A0AAW1QBL9_9CHLO